MQSLDNAERMIDPYKAFQSQLETNWKTNYIITLYSIFLTMQKISAL